MEHHTHRAAPGERSDHSDLEPEDGDGGGDRQRQGPGIDAGKHRNLE
jgi:hypothetical protein